MTNSLSLVSVTIEPGQLPVFSLNAGAFDLKEQALTRGCLIGKVTNTTENVTAVEAQKELKRVAQMFEKERKKLKEPIIEAGRKLDRLVQTEVDEVERELGRISALTSEFQQAEARRIREEEEAQRRELARIEAEKQAEFQRIAREQAERDLAARRAQEEIERKARDEREAAAKAARDATNKAQREAAEKMLEAAAKAEEANRIERERLEKESAARAAEEMRLANERAAAASIIEAKPIESSRVSGQVVKTEWDIQIVNPYDLAKFHPDCVKIEPMLTPIKAALNEGRELRGVKAVKRISADVRVRTQHVIEV